MFKKSAYIILGSILAIQFFTGSTFAADPTPSPTPTVTSSTPTPSVSESPTPTASITVTPTSSVSATPTSKPVVGGDDKKKEVLGKTSVLGSTSAGMEIAKWLVGGTVGFLTVLIGYKISRSNNVEE